MIDTHTHLYYMGRLPDEPAGLTPEQLVDRMNREGIDKSVILPIESPEIETGICLTEQAIQAAERYPERLISFIHIDPRNPHCTDLIEFFARHPLVKGFGELVDYAPIDDPLHKKVFAKCSDLGLPVVFYSSQNSCWDEVGLPRLEKCLQEYPELIFIGHGQRWWAAISADDDGAGGRYPEESVSPGGAADRLLGEYDNMYADLSANSGYNAITRDPQFTRGFIDRHWRKLLWATDYLSPGDELPQIAWIRETPMAEEHRQAIAAGNARRLLRLDE